MKNDETIFDLKPTTEEWQQLDSDYSALSPDEYHAALADRASIAGTNIDFERISDLEALSQLRGNEEEFKKYHKILTVDMKEIWNRVFSE